MTVSEEESSSGSSKSRRSTSSASAANGAYYLAKCALRGSVVLQVVHGHIRSPSSNDVVFGKMLGKDILIVLSDSGKLSVLALSNEMHRFRATSL